MHRWTPVSSTVPSWSTSTSQEVFHVDTNLPANQEFLICTLVDRAPTPFLWQPKPGFQLALLSLSQSRTLLLFLFGTPHHGPVQALFHCSNKCRLRELNGDLQTIASCSIGGQRERRSSKLGPDGQMQERCTVGFHLRASGHWTVQQCGCVM